MKANALLLVALAAFVAAATFAMNRASAAGGIKQRVSKEESLSVTATAAPIDLRQPQHLKTATFALG